MGLAAGTKLCHYEIQELIGQGDMGEVCRAQDTKLDPDKTRRQRMATHLQAESTPN
jgi:serine/threonine protein kinase